MRTAVSVIRQTENGLPIITGPLGAHSGLNGAFHCERASNDCPDPTCRLRHVDLTHRRSVRQRNRNRVSASRLHGMAVIQCRQSKKEPTRNLILL